MKMENEQKNALETLMADESVPNWAKVLIRCFQDLEGERRKVASLEQRVAKLEESLPTKDEINFLMEENRSLRIQLAGYRDELDSLEQYSRRNCLIFHELKENAKEDTTKIALDIIHNKLNIPKGQVSLKDIERTHRLGRLTDERRTRSAKN